VLQILREMLWFCRYLNFVGQHLSLLCHVTPKGRNLTGKGGTGDRSLALAGRKKKKSSEFPTLQDDKKNKYSPELCWC